MTEHREAFIQMLRAGAEVRNRAFLVLEQRHANDFENGREGVRYYNELFAAVRDAEVPEAVDEFQRRFFPLLDPHGTRREEKLRQEQQRAAGGAIPLPEPRGMRWTWMATFGAATVLAMVIFWLIVPPPPRPAPTAAPAAPAGSPAASMPEEAVTGSVPDAAETPGASDTLLDDPPVEAPAAGEPAPD